MSNVMNKNCEGCTFKLGHRCDCTNSICINNSEYTINEEDNNMNVDKKYDMLQKAFDSAIKEINSLKKELDELKQFNSKKVENVLAVYEDAFGEHGECRSYWHLDADSCPRHLETDKYIMHDTDYNPYCGYLSEDYVNIAAKMKKFNDMLLAFKWCYDRDYKPIYTTGNSKWYIYYNFPANIYSYGDIYNQIETIIYFSSEEVAKKCCDWLNEIDPNGELVKVN